MQEDAMTTKNSGRRAQAKEEQYEILPSEELLARMMKLAEDYPTFVTLTTTQEWFGLPRAGTLRRILWRGNLPCNPCLHLPPS
jgi:hypothetical protein